MLGVVVLPQLETPDLKIPYSYYSEHKVLWDLGVEDDGTHPAPTIVATETLNPTKSNTSIFSSCCKTTNPNMP